MKRLLQIPLVTRAAPPLVALSLSLLLGFLCVAAIGQNPFAVVGKTFGAFFESSRTTVTNVGYIFAEGTPLIFAGLAVALAFHAGLVNIGAQGQVLIGCFCCAWMGFVLSPAYGLAPGTFDPKTLPPPLTAWIMMPACILAAMLGGAIWGAVPGALKAYRGSHEVIITIMMNFVAVALTQYLLNEHFKDPSRQLPQSIPIVETARFTRVSALLKHGFGYEGLPPSVYLGTSLFWALGAGAGVWVLLRHTRLGYEIRAVGENPSAAEYAGIPVRRTLVLAMALSGALAGMVALDFVMGYRYLYHHDDAVGYALKGFLGLAVAILGGNQPAGIVLAALLFGLISRLGVVMQLNTEVPKDLILVLQGVIILFLIVSTEFIRRWVLRGRTAGAAVPPGAATPMAGA